MSTQRPEPDEPSVVGGAAAHGGRGLRVPFRQTQAASRIRRKLILLHTAFSLLLGTILVIAVSQAVRTVVLDAETREVQLALRSSLAVAGGDVGGGRAQELFAGVRFAQGGAEALMLGDRLRGMADAGAGDVQVGLNANGELTAVVLMPGAPGEREYRAASIIDSNAKAATNRLTLVLVAALFAVYGLIALTLELVILPRQVYLPIERLRRADAAIQMGDRGEELIPELEIPKDELGEVMRTRNQSILKLRDQERRLNSALAQVEIIASELKRKNHLLETARRNLADQDRLASLGIMSAGIAHELNTPLTVLKGTVERLIEDRGSVSPAQLALMGRVVARLERLGESLLDFARVRPPAQHDVDLRAVIEEAWTLVSIDREARAATIEIEVAPKLGLVGDPDRLTQVMVNLLRNAVDAAGTGAHVSVHASMTRREGGDWVAITVADNGPGIDPEFFPRLFEPFVTTRLDSRGTGLGLAVAEGIVREHGGVMVAQNKAAPHRGAVFEVLLPMGGIGGGGDGGGGGGTLGGVEPKQGGEG